MDNKKYYFIMDDFLNVPNKEPEFCNKSSKKNI